MPSVSALLLSVLLLAAAPASAPVDETAAAVAVIDRHLVAYNARNLEAFMAFFAPDAELYEFPDKLLAKGTEAIRARYAARLAEPNLHAEVVRRIAVGNRVIDEEHLTRTFPEGTGSIVVVATSEVKGGLITRAWFQFGERRLDPAPGTGGPKAAPTTPSPPGPAPAGEDELRSILRARKASAAAGDITAWSANVSPDCTWTDDELDPATTAQVAKELAGDKGSGTRSQTFDVQVRRFGDVAILTYRQEDRTDHNRKEVLSTYRYLDTYLLRDGRWLLVASSETPILPIPDPARAVKVSTRILDRYVGRYQYTPGNILLVWREGERLMAQNRPEEKPTPMYPESDTVFFDTLGPWRWQFVTDGAGRVKHLVFRHHGTDTEMPRLKE